MVLCYSTHVYTMNCGPADQCANEQCPIKVVSKCEGNVHTVTPLIYAMKRKHTASICYERVY